MYSSVHCVGIGGAGVRALAEYFLREGLAVTGSDLEETAATQQLRRRGASVHRGHSVGHLGSQADLLVYSAAISQDNPELQEARRRGIPQLCYAEMLGHLMRNSYGVAVAGTHGKSTTTAMLGWILTEAGFNPTVIVGAEVPQLGGSSRVGGGLVFVAEGCEFGCSFHHLSPSLAAILNIEPDHLDYYSDIEEIIESFGQFACRLPADGRLIVQGTPKVLRAVRGAGCSVETFSTEPGGDWWAADLRHERGRYRFRVFHEGDFITSIRLLVPGKHNVDNALAATALAHSLGVEPARIREAMEEFGGCRRRLEVRGNWRGATLLDDYAHHPSEIEATLTAARQMYSARRLFCVFQPHQVSRTKALFQEFSRAFAEADILVITDVYAAREPVTIESAQIAKNLAEAIAKRGTETRYLGSLGSTIAHLESHLEPGDVLLTMGAGDVWKVCDEFGRRLSQYRQAG